MAASELKKIGKNRILPNCRPDLFRFVVFWIILFALSPAAGHGAAQSLPRAGDFYQPPQKLRVAIVPVEPFVFVSGDGRVTGFSVELWEAIVAELRLDYEWSVVGTIREQLDSVQSGTADAAISAISMTPERERVIDFTHPYFDTGLQIMVRETPELKPAHLLHAFVTPGLLRILGIGLLTLVVLAHVIWLVERGKNEAVPRSYFSGVWEGMWLALHMVTSYHYGAEEKPKRVLKRLFVMGWIIVSVVLIAQFTAAITASLTVQQLTGTITSPADLPGRDVWTVSDSTAEKYLILHDIRYQGVNRVEDAYQALETGEAEALVFDSPVLRYHAQNYGNGFVDVVGPIFQDESYGIAVPAGSSLRESINETLLQLKQSGRYQEIYENWFGVED